MRQQTSWLKQEYSIYTSSRDMGILSQCSQFSAERIAGTGVLFFLLGISTTNIRNLANLPQLIDLIQPALTPVPPPLPATRQRPFNRGP